MVELIINETEHTTTVNLLEALKHFESGILMLKTQEREQRLNKPPYYVTHDYVILDEWTVKVEGDNLFIIADHICNVIDLNSEAPVSIESLER